MTLMKETKDNTNKQKGIPYSGTGKFNIVIMSILQVWYNPYQNSNGIFQRNGTILKFVWNCQKTKTKIQTAERHTQIMHT